MRSLYYPYPYRHRHPRRPTLSGFSPLRLYQILHPRQYPRQHPPHPHIAPATLSLSISQSPLLPAPSHSFLFKFVKFLRKLFKRNLLATHRRGGGEERTSPPNQTNSNSNSNSNIFAHFLMCVNVTAAYTHHPLTHYRSDIQP